MREMLRYGKRSTGDPGVHLIQCRMLGERRAISYETDRADDEGNANPAGQTEMLMQPKATNQREDDVSKCSGGHDEGEVGPAQCGHVAGEKPDQQQDSQIDEWVKKGAQQEPNMMQVYGADLRHTP